MLKNILATIGLAVIARAVYEHYCNTGSCIAKRRSGRRAIAQPGPHRSLSR